MNEQAYREAERALWESYGASPTERHVEVHGARIRVQSIGSGEPIVFIAGSPNAGSTWAPLIAELSGFACHVLDRPGTGLSDKWPAAETRDTVTDVIDAVLDELGAPSAHLVGSSLGGWWALVYALAHPERTTTMTQLGAPAGVPTERMPFGVRVMAAIPGAAWLMGAMKPSDSMVRSMFKSIGHGASLDSGVITKPLLDWYRALLIHTPSGRNEMERDAKTLSLFSRRLLGIALSAEELATLRVPTTYLWGTADNYGGEDVARATAECCAHAGLEILDGAGHLPWLDDPIRCAAHIRQHATARAGRAA
jgi:pimeloyl-ACP methyl ester carboxylesterase